MSLKKSQSFHAALHSYGTTTSNNNNTASQEDKEKDDESQPVLTVVQNPIFKPRVTLVEALLSSDFELVGALGENVLVAEEGRTLAEAMIDFFQAHNKLDKLMEWAIAKEVNSTSSTSTLFRGACEATKLMPVLYSRLGSEYLRQLVGPLVKDITGSSQSFEIDPNKAEKGVDTKDNLKKVLSITTEFLHHIYESLDRCPSFLRYLFWFAKKEVTKKFPQASSIIVGVFFFLRFMIPAIVTPTTYGLILEQPTQEAQRGLILISKLLQNLSNGIEFDDSHEEYRMEMNKFIVDKMLGLQSFFNKLAEKTTTVEPPPFYVSAESGKLALSIISNSIKENKEKVYNSLTKSETKKILVQYCDGGYDTIPASQTDSLRTRSLIGLTTRRAKSDKTQKVLTDIQIERISKLEEQLEEEIKRRKALEVTIQDLANQFKLRVETLETNLKIEADKRQHLEQRIALLEKQAISNNKHPV